MDLHADGAGQSSRDELARELLPGLQSEYVVQESYREDNNHGRYQANQNTSARYIGPQRLEGQHDAYGGKDARKNSYPARSGNRLIMPFPELIRLIEESESVRKTTTQRS